MREYCETDRFTASCQDDEVIFMERALYGRMRLGRCVKQDLGFIGCYQDVLGLANWKCSGRRHCSILIPDPDFDTTKPCLQELKTFFEASYICLKGELCLLKLSPFYFRRAENPFPAFFSLLYVAGYILNGFMGRLLAVSVANLQ